MLKRAKDKGLLSIDIVDIRQFSKERFRKVDDRPYGGGPGMVMMADPLASAIRSKVQTGRRSRRIYMSPQGKPLTAEKCRELAQYEQLIIVSGHYEGIDQRVLDSDIDEEISIGDYVLTNGSLAAIVLVDSTCRFIPGVLGDEDGASRDSFEEGIFDWPHYTRPEVFEGTRVPEVLLGGDHEKIDSWRRREALEKTKRVRPELWLKHVLKTVEVSKEPRGEAVLCEVVIGCKSLKETKAFCKKYFKPLLGEVTKDEVTLTFNGMLVRFREDVQEPAFRLEVEQETYSTLARRVEDIQESEYCLLDPSGLGWRVQLKMERNNEQT